MGLSLNYGIGLHAYDLFSTVKFCCSKYRSKFDIMPFKLVPS
jgi:hypothetical protein